MVDFTSQNDNELIKDRRWFHQHPELSDHEKETAAYISKRLHAMDIKVIENVGGHGVLGIINEEKTSRTIGLRADMDALPIREKNDLPYRSKNEGVMHACGHDAHMAMLLNAAKILQEQRDELNGRVVCIFQPAEENAPVGGAKKMLADPQFQQYQPDVIFGQHVWPDLNTGEIGIRDQEMMGASDRFKIVIIGQGGHASMPHQAKDAIVATGQLIQAIQTIISRSINPLDTGVITIGTINGGYAPNIIADEVVLEGTVRSYSKETSRIISNRLNQICENIGHTFDVKINLSYVEGYEATVNHKEWAECVREEASKLKIVKNIPDVLPSLAAEDFSRFLNVIPGAFYWLGIKNEEICKPLHDPEFNLDENAMTIGSQLLVNVTKNALTKKVN